MRREKLKYFRYMYIRMGHEKSQDGSSRAYTLDLDLLIVIMGREKV
jgi:hypothetical protein